MAMRRSPQRPIEEVLGGDLADGVLIRPLRKEPPDRPVDPVPLAQFAEQDRTQDRHPLASALGMGNPQLHPRSVNVADLNVGCLGEAQTASEDRHEEDAPEGIPFGPHGDQPFDLFDAEHPRRLGLTGRTLDADQVRLDVLSEQPVVEGPKRIDCQVDLGGASFAKASAGREKGCAR